LEKTVSVIIPVYNASFYIDETLRALLSQTYSSKAIEILVVDNGSTDGTEEIVKKYPVKLIFEREKAGPYAARNKGLLQAKGEIIALTDANKVPDKNWIESGVRALERKNSHLAGGDIIFELGNDPSAAELYDAITFNNNRNLVLFEQGSATGNLFFKKKILDELGLFPDVFRSGMDIWWTQRAVRLGYKLVFADKAIVKCKPRTFVQVLCKSYRVGKVHPFNMKQNGKPASFIFGQVIRTFAPPKINPLKEKLTEKQLNQQFFYKVWSVAWLSKICMGTGRARGFLFMNKRIQDFT